MHARMHTYMGVIHTYTDISTIISIHVHMSDIYVHIYIYIYIDTYVRMYVCGQYVCMICIIVIICIRCRQGVCTCVCMYVCMYVCP